MVRIAHLSDIHITVKPLGWQLRDCFSKRATTWLNLRFGRAANFAAAPEVLTRLMDELVTRNIDHVAFSGDATALGFDAELARAAQLLRVGTIPGMAVPGNHDFVTSRAAASGEFERRFAPWQTGSRIGAHVYPFAQRVGDVWLIGVNAATGNRLPWDATGTVGREQRERLQRLLETLAPGARILVIHYPVCLADGRHETWQHGLRDLPEVLDVARAGGVGLWLHGHRHGPYFIDDPALVAFPVICAGSSTQRGIASYNEYCIDGLTVRAVRRAYDAVAHQFGDVQAFELRLRSP